MSVQWRSAGLAVLPVATLLLLWEAVSRSGAVNPLLFPPPSRVAAALAAMTADGTLLQDAAASGWRVIAGVCAGAYAGIAAGLLTGRSAAWNRALAPVINMLRPLPPVAIIPLVIVWFGIGDAAKIFSIAMAAFFPVWLNTHAGAAGVAHEHLWSARLLTRSRILILTRVILPAALPFIVVGLRTAIATGFVMVFVSELAGAESGLGYRISITQLAFRVDRMMAALAVLALLCALADLSLSAAVRRLFPWLPRLHD